MQLEEVVNGVRDALTIKRVFGEPYERDGVTVIPAAVVRGRAGGGEGQGVGPEAGKQGKGSGFGAGFGLNARPVGLFVIKGGSVSFRPAFDVNRAIRGAQIVVGLAFLTFRAFFKTRTKRRRRFF